MSESNERICENCGGTREEPLELEFISGDCKDSCHNKKGWAALEKLTRPQCQAFDLVTGAQCQNREHDGYVSHAPGAPNPLVEILNNRVAEFKAEAATQKARRDICQRDRNALEVLLRELGEGLGDGETAIRLARLDDLERDMRWLECGNNLHSIFVDGSTSGSVRFSADAGVTWHDTLQHAIATVRKE